MREIIWENLERDKQYYIVKNKSMDKFSEKIIGTFKYNSNTFANPIASFSILQFPKYSIHEFHTFSYRFYEIPFQYIQEICDYIPKKIPSLHTLTKYQLTTEEIRFARMYDGLF